MGGFMNCFIWIISLNFSFHSSVFFCCHSITNKRWKQRITRRIKVSNRSILLKCDEM
jgi:hypothetical protein